MLAQASMGWYQRFYPLSTRLYQTLRASRSHATTAQKRG